MDDRVGHRKRHSECARAGAERRTLTAPLAHRWRRAAALVIALLATLVPSLALAHKPSDSYLTLHADAQITGQWDIALRDLDFAVGLDTDGDGNITWGEVRARHADIAAYAQRNVVMRDGLILKDFNVAQRLDATTELEKIAPIDSEVQP